MEDGFLLDDFPVDSTVDVILSSAAASLGIISMVTGMARPSCPVPAKQKERYRGKDVGRSRRTGASNIEGPSPRLLALSHNMRCTLFDHVPIRVRLDACTNQERRSDISGGPWSPEFGRGT